MSVGLQGSLLAPFLQGSVRLAGLVVSADAAAAPGAQLSAMYRAVVSRRPERRHDDLIDAGSDPGRKEEAPAPLLDLTQRQFKEGKNAREIRFRKEVVYASTPSEESARGRKRPRGDNDEMKKQKPKPSGTSLNWIADPPQSSSTAGRGDRAETKSATRRAEGGTYELTQALTGLLLGLSKKTTETLLNHRDDCGNDGDAVQPHAKAESRLSRRSLVLLAGQVAEGMAGHGSPSEPGRVCVNTAAYLDWKTGGVRACQHYTAATADFHSHAPFDKWTRNIHRNFNIKW